MTITVHHLNNSRSLRILWLLEELDLDYQIKFYQRNPRTMLAPTELKKVHPLGKSPVITHDGQTIAESGLIVEYLLGCCSNLLMPRGSEMQVKYWLHYAEGSLMPLLLLKLVFARLSQPPVPFLLRPLTKAIASQVGKAFTNPQLATHLRYIEDTLSKNPWFAGTEFSAADIQMSFPLEAALEQNLIDKDYSNIIRFVAKIQERPAYERARQKIS